jgi:hypothetical protein
MHPTQHRPADVQIWTPADTLRAAARYLERHGWIRGNYYDRTVIEAFLFDPDTTSPFPPACAIGAMAIALYGEVREIPESDNLERELNLAKFALLDYLDLAPYTDPDDDDNEPEPIGVYAWNDSQHNAADVIYALRKAADAWDAQHTWGGGA